MNLRKIYAEDLFFHLYFSVASFFVFSLAESVLLEQSHMFGVRVECVCVCVSVQNVRFQNTQNERSVDRFIK